MEKFLLYCRHLGLSPDEACTLLALTSPIDLHKSIRTYFPSLEHLYVDKFIDYRPGVEKSKSPQELFMLTEKGQAALLELSNCFPQTENMQKTVRSSARKPGNKVTDEMKKFVESYRELFPKGKVGNSTKSYRATPKEIYDRLKWFKESYPEFWDFDLMLQATQEYHRYIKQKRSTFIKSAGYFIKKQDESKINQSMMADWCQMIMDGDHEDEQRKHDIVQKFNNFDVF